MNSQSNRQTETKFDNLMHSVMAKAKKTNEKQIEMIEKEEYFGVVFFLTNNHTNSGYL